MSDTNMNTSGGTQNEKTGGERGSRQSWWRSPAALAIAASAALSAAVYGGYWWGGADELRKHATPPGEMAPMPAVPESGAINMGE